MDSGHPTTSQALHPQGGGDHYGKTVDGQAQEQVEHRGADHDLSQGTDTAAAAETGDPPLAQQTHDHLPSATSSTVSGDASQTAETHPLGDATLPETHDQRKTNYAPGYQGAYDAVPRRTYNETGHSPVDLPHEQLESGSGN